MKNHPSLTIAYMRNLKLFFVKGILFENVLLSAERNSKNYQQQVD
jgi:hypothetical protein